MFAMLMPAILERLQPPQVESGGQDSNPFNPWRVQHSARNLLPALAPGNPVLQIQRAAARRRAAAPPRRRAATQ